LDVLAGKDPQLSWKDESCVGVVVASKGYPNAYDKGVPIPEKEVLEDVFVVQAGTQSENESLVSNGGRVLFVGAIGKNMEDARSKAYDYLTVFDETDHFFYRLDIGKQ